MSDTLRGSSIVRSLVAEYAYARRTEPFTLSSGVTSYDYIDGKQILLVNELQEQVGGEMVRAIEDRQVEYSAVGGLELGAIYVAQALLVHEWIKRSRRLASFVVRKKAKAHGKGLKIEGPSVTGQCVVVVDDVVTTGDSIIRAVDAVRNEGADVVLTITLVDRGDIAGSRLADLGVPYHALTTYRDYGIDPVVEAELPVAGELVELRQLQLPRADRLPDLISWCWDKAYNSGDARYAGIARSLEEIEEAWDVKGGLPQAIIKDLNAALQRHMPDILTTPDASSGSAQARWMRDEVGRALDAARA
jgi:orotate phosphoribosyltransferase